MSVYSKKGDKGKTCLFDSGTGKRIKVKKDNLRLEVIGTIDELNSCLGVVKSLLMDSEDNKFIERIQRDLFLINSLVAGVKKLRFAKTKVNYLEKKIDLLEKELPRLKNFILPGGTLVSSFLHLARTIARRVERSVSKLNLEEKVNPNILVFINRLSDTLFTMARWENFSRKETEVEWGTK